jgi:hypothetical protein
MKLLKSVLGVVVPALVLVSGTAASYAAWQVHEFDVTVGRVYELGVQEITASLDRR